MQKNYTTLIEKAAGKNEIMSFQFLEKVLQYTKKETKENKHMAEKQMMKKRTHFMAMLGTNLYEPVYYWENEEEKESAVEDEYVQLTVIRKYIEELRENGKITLFVTSGERGSEKKNLKNRIYDANDEVACKRWVSVSKEKVKEGTEKKGLYTQLIEEFPELKEKVNIVNIPNGKNETEIWEIFEKIYQEIEEDDEVVFDVTHSFRSLSIIAVVVLNYARTMKSCDLKGFHYGLFEEAEKEADKKYVLLVDMSPMIEMLLWSDAANSFIRYGNASEISELQKRREKRASIEERKTQEWKQLGKMIEAMELLGETISCCRGSNTTDGTVNTKNAKKSIKMAYRYLEECSTEMAKEKAKASKPMSELLARAGRSFERFDREENYKIGLSVVEWSIENNMIQQGYTALEETVKTYMCYKYNLDDSSETIRDSIVGTVLNALNVANAELSKEKKNKEKNKEEQLEENKKICVDNREDLRAYIWENDCILKEKILKISEDEKAIYDEILLSCPMELAKIAGTVKKRRNDLNHFGFNPQPGTSDSLKSSLKDNFEMLKNCLSAQGDL